MSKPVKIEGTVDAWESGKLGNDAAHAVPASANLQSAIDASLGLQTISIRLPKNVVDAYKLIASHHDVGYQPLMRDILQRYVKHGLKEVLEHHQAKLSETGIAA